MGRTGGRYGSATNRQIVRISDGKIEKPKTRKPFKHTEVASPEALGLSRDSVDEKPLEKLKELKEYLGIHRETYDKHREVSVATGALAAPFIKKMADELKGMLADTDIHVYAIRNDFFGENITVAGLLTIIITLCILVYVYITK